MEISSFKHKPILVEEILSLFPSHFKNGWALDTTFGAGGHTTAILRRYTSCSVVALDRDLSAIQWGLKNIKPHFPDKRLHLIHADFHQYAHLVQNQFPLFIKEGGFDIIIMDLGVSSPQLDQAHRGFSFYKEGPLDMRMDTTQSFTAYDIINSWSEAELMDLFYSYGEIYNSSSVVKMLIRERKRSPIDTTKKLADLIVKKQGWRKKRTHPATSYFLALRLKVNNELDGLKQVVPQMIQSLHPKGRFFILTFHSLEDRIIKNIFKQVDKVEGYNLTKKVIMPTREEVKQNPRARSAKLRVFEKKGTEDVLSVSA